MARRITGDQGGGSNLVQMLLILEQMKENAANRRAEQRRFERQIGIKEEEAAMKEGILTEKRREKRINELKDTMGDENLPEETREAAKKEYTKLLDLPHMPEKGEREEPGRLEKAKAAIKEKGLIGVAREDLPRAGERIGERYYSLMLGEKRGKEAIDRMGKGLYNLSEALGMGRSGKEYQERYESPDVMLGEKRGEEVIDRMGGQERKQGKYESPDITLGATRKDEFDKLVNILTTLPKDKVRKIVGSNSQVLKALEKRGYNIKE